MAMKQVRSISTVILFLLSLEASLPADPGAPIDSDNNHGIAIPQNRSDLRIESSVPLRRGLGTRHTRANGMELLTLSREGFISVVEKSATFEEQLRKVYFTR